MKTTTVRLTPQIHEILKKAAYDTGLSRNALINLSIREYLGSQFVNQSGLSWAQIAQAAKVKRSQ